MTDPMEQARDRIQELENALDAAVADLEAKEQEASLFGFMSARKVGAVLKRYGIRSHPIGGRRLFRPSQTKLLAIQNSYGVDLGLNVIESPEKVAECAN